MEFPEYILTYELPEDVLIIILAYLPVKSLMRFRCISKSWYALIRSPAFINLHLNCDRKEIMLLKRYIFRGVGDEEDLLSFHDPDSLDSLLSPDISVPLPEDVPNYPCDFPGYIRTCPRPSVSLFGPCNGIVCIEYANRVLLCNPALREFKQCPPCLVDCPAGYYSNSTFGFGFDPASNVYKLVSLHKIAPLEYSGDPPALSAADLYDSSTNSWRQIDTSMVSHCSPTGAAGCLLNGIFHWIVNLCPRRRNTSIIDPDLDPEIYEEFGPQSMGNMLHFNMSTEVFGEFDFPCWIIDKHSALTVLNGHLAVIRYVNAAAYEGEPKLVDIWVMKEYGVNESWTKQYVIGPYIFIQAFFCWKNEWLVVGDKDGQLASCAFDTNEIKKFQFCGRRTTLHGVLYKESLISVDDLATVP